MAQPSSAGSARTVKADKKAAKPKGPALCLTVRCVLRIKFWLSITLPICYLPLLALTQMSMAGRCGYMMALMLNFYLMHLMVPVIVALFPVFLCPVLALNGSDEICESYYKELTIFLMCSMIAATGIFHSNLHRRFILLSLLTMGSSPRWLLLGFMLPTMFISMWANNIASCFWVTRVANNLFNDLESELQLDEYQEALAVSYPNRNPRYIVEYYMTNTRKMILIGVAYASTIGGIGTLTGTGTNLVLLGVLEDCFPEKNFQITYLTWMACNVPLMIVNICGAWIIVQAMFPGFPKGTIGQRTTKEILSEQYKQLGGMSWHEVLVLVFFALLVSLWILQDPLGNDKGWVTLFPHHKELKIKYSIPAVFMVSLFFLFPARCKCWCLNLEDPSLDRAPATLIRWYVFHKWINSADSLIILGSGRAILAALKVSGLEDVVRSATSFMKPWPEVVNLLIVLLFTSITTSLARNIATATIILPIVMLLQKSMDAPVLLFLYPTTIICSYAFVLPGSTPANIVAFTSGHVRILDLLKTGMLIWIVCVVVLLLATYFYIPYILDMTYK